MPSNPRKKNYLPALKKLIHDPLKNVWDTCDILLEYIFSLPTDQQELAFMSLLRDINISDYQISQSSDDLHAMLTQHNIADLLPVFSRILKNLLTSECHEEYFYKKLWNSLKDDALFSSREDQVSFLFLLWSDTRIPYTNLGKGLSMTDDEFVEHVNALEDEISQMKRIINSDLPQRTQTTSLIMNIADSIKDNNSRIVFWAIAFAYFSDHIFEKTKDMIQKSTHESSQFESTDSGNAVTTE